MNKNFRLIVFALVSLVLVGLIVFFMNTELAVLSPKGQIASQQRQLIFISTLLMLIIVVPVFILTFFISWRYRAGSKKSKYSPDWDHNRLIEFTWWAIPSAIILVLAVITWQGTHELDPNRPLQSQNRPLNVQVVALQWKWLFIYPDYGIASVNYLKIPQDTPVNFEITSDAPINSFWVPQLGGQVYAMPGRITKLNLIADEPGKYAGRSANISGEGFSKMGFILEAGSISDFQNYIKEARDVSNKLSVNAYNKLARPGTLTEKITYSSTESGLLDTIVTRYTQPMGAEGEGGARTEQSAP